MPDILSQIGEFGLIERLRKMTPGSTRVLRGIGDDTAVLDLGAKDLILLTTDMLVEGGHFTRRDPPELIGRKAMACSISDIAAMGGLPTFAVVSFGCPPRLNVKFAEGIYKGLLRLARAFDVTVVGGDTVKSGHVVVNVALLGKVPRRQLVTRGGARPGDVIFVTGPLGGSLQSGKHMSFMPRVREARFLAARLKPSAMIDISDGLCADLGHVLQQSRAGALLDAGRIPRGPRSSLHEALVDGEDFELLFVLTPRAAARLKRMKKVPFPFYEIGKITTGAGRLSLVDAAGRQQTLHEKGFKHF